MQLQIHLIKGELTGIRAGFQLVACSQHLVEQVLRDGIAGFVVAGEQIETLAIPAPVFKGLEKRQAKNIRIAGHCLEVGFVVLNENATFEGEWS